MQFCWKGCAPAHLGVSSGSVCECKSFSMTLVIDQVSHANGSAGGPVHSFTDVQLCIQPDSTSIINIST